MKLRIKNTSIFFALLLGILSAPQGFAQQSQPVVNSQPNQASQAAPAVSQSNTDLKNIKDWFKRYDVIRRTAQLSPKDKARANQLLSKGLAIIIPGDDKIASQKLLKDLVTRYSTAEEQIKLLPLYPETEKLHRGYYQYFNNAKLLFSDYMAVQNNVLATDSYGNPLGKTLLVRKQNLEMLDNANKSLDTQLRKQFGIEQYRYSPGK